MDDELRGLLARYARGELSADDARRAILRYPKWRVAEIDGELETVALDDGTPMLIAESSASDGREYSGLELVRDIAPLVGGLSFDPDEPWGSAFRPARCPSCRTGRARSSSRMPLPNRAPASGICCTKGRGGLPSPGHRPACRSPRRRVGRHHDHDRAGRGGDIPANRATPRTRRRAVGSRTLGRPRQTQRLRRRSAQSAASTRPAVAAARPRDAGRRMRSAPERRATARPHGCRNPSVAGSAWGASRKRELSNRATPVGEVTVARAWWNYDRREIAFTRVAPASDTEGLGSVPSRILCAGKLRQSIQSKLAGLPRLTWRADAWHRQRAALAVGWALELEKLVCGERVPFAALRTPEGAHLWHLEPQAFTARAIRKLRDRAASFR